ncbi:16S rRNA (guanine(527)-N(7))-methyltransferase RsmG [[Bacteroides] pectinophilus]|nr:16S rRNA (guanine(527)-N(7))-methyltransferase RsmG [[Bacteroides] pectinophilus]
MNFTDALNEINVELDDSMEEALQKYYELLVEWNKVMNLTAITEKDDVYVKHFLDSLAVKTVFDDKEYAKMLPDTNTAIKVIDIGTGAGFPGIPLKIAFPSVKVTLLDSLNKRIKFLNEVISTVGLNDIEAIHGRAEDYAREPDYRESYDLCVSRAVATLSTLAEYCLPYVKTGGYFISYKSGDIDDELKTATHALKLLGAKTIGVKKLTLPGTDIERSFVIIKKMAHTDKKYPRKAGLPSSKPL